MKSIGTRLALWYAGVSTVTLICLFVAGYYLLNEHLIDGLRKAGLEVAGDSGASSAKPAADARS